MSLSGRKTLSDIEFLMKKEFDSKLRTAEGTLSVTGDLATLTANSGKDMYLAKAKVSARSETTNTSNDVAIVELKVNGAVKATWVCQLNVTSSGAGTTNPSYEFVVSGLKVAATEIIKLEVISLNANVEVSGELVVVEETTGESPVI